MGGENYLFMVVGECSGTDFYVIGTILFTTGHGKVTMSGWNFGCGRQIKISHCSGYESSYIFLYRLFVKVGDSVSWVTLC